MLMLSGAVSVGSLLGLFASSVWSLLFPPVQIPCPACRCQCQCQTGVAPACEVCGEVTLGWHRIALVCVVSFIAGVALTIGLIYKAWQGLFVRFHIPKAKTQLRSPSRVQSPVRTIPVNQW